MNYQMVHFLNQEYSDKCWWPDSVLLDVPSLHKLLAKDNLGQAAEKDSNIKKEIILKEETLEEKIENEYSDLFEKETGKLYKFFG